VGLARAAFDLASAYAKERASFERRLVDNQAVAFPLVELATEIEAARLLAYKAAWLADNKVRHKKESSMAKYFAAELAVKASLLAVSVLGGEGTTTDQPAERYLRDATTFQFAQGSPQVQRVVVAHELFD
jgi:alkylation response protein AidB-like acyl-CoA dehydrogenase